MTNQDIDLQKIQILESSYQGWFNFRVSIIAGGFIGILILVATISYENIIPAYGAIIGYVIVFIAAFFMMIEMSKMHNNHIIFISNLITKVENGEKLDSIEKLREENKKKVKNYFF
jgi:hypothetical protein